MHGIPLRPNPNSTYKLLLLGAHCDDIEIGCGATILQLIEENPKMDILWVAFSSDSVRKQEALKSAKHYLERAKNHKIEILDFRNAYFPSERDEIKDYFEKIKLTFEPDIIFTHYKNDAHQDHRTINELTWNTFRDHLILEYEIPKYDGDVGRPNTYCSISDDIRKSKIDSLMRFYGSQQHRHWFTASTFNALMRLRGIESNAPSGYAEAFYSRKISIK